MSDLPLYKKLYNARIEWAKKDAVASRLEALRKPLRATIYLSERQTSNSVADAELKAEANEKYKQHIESMIVARQAANEAWAKVEGVKEKIKELERQDIANAVEAKYSSGYGGK